VIVWIQYLEAALATVRRDASIYLSYRLRFASQILAMVFTLTIFFYVSKLVRPDAVGHHGQYYQFVVVGIVTLAILEAALTISQLVRLELVAGNFERLVISPFGPVAGAMSMAAFPIGFAMLFAVIMLAVAAGVFGLPVHVGGIPLALVVAGLGGVTFAAIGLLFVSALIAYKSAMGATWVMAALGLIGGIYFPISLFPGWIRWAADVQPLTPAVDLLRHALVGTPSMQAKWVELLKLGGFAAVLMPVAGMTLWQAVKISRRRGTLMEY